MICVVAAKAKADWAQALAAALAPAEIAETLAAVRDAALCVVHIDGVDLAQSAPSCPVIAVMPAASLGAAVDLMDVSPNIAGVTFDERVDHVAALATRALVEPGGVAALMPGAEVHSHTVRDFADKTRCLAQISRFVSGARVEPIEQCVDEMLMNALYDAPVDERGEHVFAGVPARERVTMRTAQSVGVEYARSDKRLVVLVRDAFGSLSRDTVVRHLQKAAAIERKAGGAGLGLYLMTTAASAVMFHVVPGVATTVTCTFDFEQPQLTQLAFVEHDVAGRAKTPPARVIKRRRRAPLIAGAALVLAAAAVAVVAWPRAKPVGQITFTTTPGAVIDLDGQRAGSATGGTLVARDLVIGRAYRVVARLPGYATKRAVVQARAGANEVAFALEPVATVEVASEPPDAIVEFDGKPVGTTPMELTTLVPGSSITLAFKRPGYRAVTARVQVPARGQKKRIAQALEPMPGVVAVHFESTPSGAAIVREGEQLVADRTYTPADVIVEAGQLQRFTLVMPGYQPLLIEPFTPVAGARIAKGGVLVPVP